ncbi:MAG: ATP-binding cassette domain-containing protein [Actinophytocola sp.]|nr:ATP-binding cassette domain-containing protein [Actinophytocola sp.]
MRMRPQDDPPAPRGEDTAALRVDELVAGYAGATILRGVSLAVKPGEIVAVLGRNGAGKTTLLRCMSGLVPARAGRIWLRDEDITRMSPTRRVAAGLAHVPEGRRMIRGLTVRENLLVGGYVTSRRAVARRLAEVLDLFPVVGGWLNREASNLSGGQQQLVAAARALMSPARVLLLDEPLTGLAPSVAYQVLDVVSEFRRHGRAVLLIEQNAHMALEIADSAFVLDGGLFTGYDHGGADAVVEIERGYLGLQRG